MPHVALQHSVVEPVGSFRRVADKPHFWGIEMRRFAITAAALLAGAMPASAFAQASASAPAYINYTQNVGGTFGNNDPTVYPPLFNDLYTFTTNFARNASVVITSSIGTRDRAGAVCTDADHSGCDFSQNVNFVTNGVKLDLERFTTTQTGVNEERTLFNFRIPAGVHNIMVRGAAGQNGVYAGILTLSAVPEPATWALMIVGFGLTGAAMRRRAQPKTTVTFA